MSGRRMLALRSAGMQLLWVRTRRFSVPLLTSPSGKMLAVFLQQPKASVGGLFIQPYSLSPVSSTSKHSYTLLLCCLLFCFTFMFFTSLTWYVYYTLYSLEYTLHL